MGNFINLKKYCLNIALKQMHQMRWKLEVEQMEKNKAHVIVVLYFDVQCVLMRYLITVRKGGTEKIWLKRKLILKVTFLNVRNQICKEKCLVSTIGGFVHDWTADFFGWKYNCCICHLVLFQIICYFILYHRKKKYEKRKK